MKYFILLVLIFASGCKKSKPVQISGSSQYPSETIVEPAKCTVIGTVKR